MSETQFEIRPIKRVEWEMAMQLVWDTFMIFEAPEYEPLGVKNFHEFVKGKELKQLYILGEYPVYAAYDGPFMVGVIGIRKRSHISLLFVDGEYHRRGIASALVKQAFYEGRRNGISEMTVNSSPYAVQFYHKIGFTDTDKELASDGIRYTPMKIRIR